MLGSADEQCLCLMTGLEVYRTIIRFAAWARDSNRRANENLVHETCCPMTAHQFNLGATCSPPTRPTREERIMGGHWLTQRVTSRVAKVQTRHCSLIPRLGILEALSYHTHGFVAFFSCSVCLSDLSSFVSVRDEKKNREMLLSIVGKA